MGSAISVTSVNAVAHDCVLPTVFRACERPQANGSYAGYYGVKLWDIA